MPIALQSPVTALEDESTLIYELTNLGRLQRSLSEIDLSWQEFIRSPTQLNVKFESRFAASTGQSGFDPSPSDAGFDVGGNLYRLEAADITSATIRIVNTMTKNLEFSSATNRFIFVSGICSKAYRNLWLQNCVSSWKIDSGLENLPN